MRAVVQRVLRASVAVRDQITGEIGKGLMVLIGVEVGDGERDAAYIADKVLNLRVFEDDAGKMNRSLLDVGGGLLVISQFTLYGDAAHGRRPSFTGAARPEVAIPLYEKFIGLCRGYGVPVATGEFGAEMLVSIENDGPVTIMVESR